MGNFIMNGQLWQVYFVNPSSPLLIERTGKRTVATTDPVSRCVYLSANLKGAFLNKVLIHELGHCALFSYGLLDQIHQMVKQEYWIDAEEAVCNFIADYGLIIFSSAQSLLSTNMTPVMLKGALKYA